MLIDWFTVAAQLVNFLILVWILKRFLYGPVVRAMQGRKDRIAAEVEQARQEREKAERRRQELLRERRDLDEQKERLLDEARQEVENWRKQAMDKAKADVDEARSQWQEGLRREQQRDLDQLKNRVARAVMDVSAKVLGDLADHKLAARAADTFLNRLAEAKEAGDDAQGFNHTGTVTVRVPASLESGERENLDARLKELFPKASAFDVQERDDVDFGLRIVAGDRKWDWNLETYLRGLEFSVFGGLAHGPQQPAEAEAATETAS